MDYPSRDLFKKLMPDEESHIDFLETQLALITKLCQAFYLQAHLGGLGEGGTPGLRDA